MVEAAFVIQPADQPHDEPLASRVLEVIR